MFFPVVTYRCESWSIKKAECGRTDALELGCWRRLFRVPWTARRSNQSILKEINPEYSLKGLMPKLKFPILWSPDAKSRLIGKMLGKIKVRRRRGQQKKRWLDGITDSMDMSLSKLLEMMKEGQRSLACCSPWGRKDLDTTEQLNNNVGICTSAAIRMIVVYQALHVMSLEPHINWERMILISHATVTNPSGLKEAEQPVRSHRMAEPA